MAPTTFRVEGLGDLLRTLEKEPKEIRKDVRRRLRDVAVPIRNEATALFLADVNPDPRRTRYGISVRKGREGKFLGDRGVEGSISVEQRLRRSTRKERRRPMFAAYQKKQALQPAFEHNIGRAEGAFRDVLDDLERRWGRAGV